MSCDEFYDRHFHKKVTHTHPHSNDSHHHHTHSGDTNGHDHPPTGLSREGDVEHLHEHTHEAEEHDHPHSLEHDPLHPSSDLEMLSTSDSKNFSRKKELSSSQEPIQTEEK